MVVVVEIERKSSSVYTFLTARTSLQRLFIDSLVYKSWRASFTLVTLKRHSAIIYRADWAPLYYRRSDVDVCYSLIIPCHTYYILTLMTEAIFREVNRTCVHYQYFHGAKIWSAVFRWHLRSSSWPRQTLEWRNGLRSFCPSVNLWTFRVRWTDYMVFKTDLIVSLTFLAV